MRVKKFCGLAGCLLVLLIAYNLLLPKSKKIKQLHSVLPKIRFPARKEKGYDFPQICAQIVSSPSRHYAVNSPGHF